MIGLGADLDPDTEGPRRWALSMIIEDSFSFRSLMILFTDLSQSAQVSPELSGIPRKRRLFLLD
jgi:hypothetical protein